MSGNSKRLLVVQVAGLGHDFLVRHHGADLDDLTFQPMQSEFPAVTCTAQAAFRTGLSAGQHGMIANGFMDRAFRRPLFWEQSSALVAGPRIWDSFRAAGHSVALICWQQSMGESVDMLLTPAPIHKHHGGMIQDCYCQPAELYGTLTKALGRPFELKHYWGPLASTKASRWISDATEHVLSQPSLQPDLCLTYLPGLDYDLQRFGVDHSRSQKALQDILTQLAQLLQAAKTNDYEVLIFGDYAIADCPNGAIHPNRALLNAGLLDTRKIRNMLYADLHLSKAFAMVDHEVAHVYIRDEADINQVGGVMRGMEGVDRVLDRSAQDELGIGHVRSGDLIVEAQAGYWLAYPWWAEARHAPDYAQHVDIHSKPGYDPCELFLGWPPGSVSLDTKKVRGTHGRVGPDRATCWASTCLQGEPESLCGLAAMVREWLG